MESPPSRRAGIFEVLEERLRAGLYANEDEAVAVLQEREKKRKELRSLEVIDGSGVSMNAEEGEGGRSGVETGGEDEAAGIDG